MLCTSGEAGEPAQQPSGRLRDSRETEAEESRSGIFKSMFGCRFWGTVNRGRGWGMLGLSSLLKVSFPDLIDFLACKQYIFKITRTQKQKIYPSGLWGRKCGEPSAAKIGRVSRVTPPGHKSIPFSAVLSILFKASRDQQVLPVSVVSRRSSPAEETGMPLWTHFPSPKLSLLSFQPSRRLSCLSAF